ncbi:hypothetical protein [Streptomyces atratus]|uniref:hypothetical protein n=1 Tax=Streptomyces atratus TaxID=1893 RepID=UPI001E4B0BAE|nr:hypothetical protein [Streptomyces atratus]
MDVTAHPGLAGEQVLLATWPGLNGDWSDIVRLTVPRCASCMPRCVWPRSCWAA